MINSDGYEWLERFDRNVFQKAPGIRNLMLCYYQSFSFERYKSGVLYRMIGVHIFGRYLPTGGIQFRRWTNKRMHSYTLKGISIAAAKEFRYKSCFFETLHLPFFIVLVWRSLWWYLEADNLYLAVELFLVNAIFNIYPIMHQRYTRVRIGRLIAMKDDLPV